MSEQESVARSWTRLAQGDRGWTGVARLAVWLCVPALITGMAGAVSQILALDPQARASGRPALAGGVAIIAMLFGMPAMITTPVAAVLILVLSLLRRWQLRVVGALWVIAILSMAIVWPAVDAAMRNWLILDSARFR